MKYSLLLLTVFFVFFPGCHKRANVKDTQLQSRLSSVHREILTARTRGISMEKGKELLAGLDELQTKYNEYNRTTALLPFYKALVYFILHDYKGAEFALSKAFKIDPYFDYGFYLRYLLLKQLSAKPGDFTELLDNFKKYSPDKVFYNYLSADYALYTGDYEEADRFRQTAASYVENTSEFYLPLERLKAAIELLKSAAPGEKPLPMLEFLTLETLRDAGYPQAGKSRPQAAAAAVPVLIASDLYGWLLPEGEPADPDRETEEEPEKTALVDFYGIFFPEYPSLAEACRTYPDMSLNSIDFLLLWQELK